MSVRQESGVRSQKSKEVTEAQARAMRDQVFGKPSTDKNWEACRENWMRPDSIIWLKSWTNWRTERGIWRATAQ